MLKDGDAAIGASAEKADLELLSFDRKFVSALKSVGVQVKLLCNPSVHLVPRPGPSDRARVGLDVNTPASSHLDALGRVFLAVADNGPDGQYVTETILDIEGHPLVIIDARGNQTMLYLCALGPGGASVGAG